MPRYEYRCDGCDRVFEVSQKFADPPLTICEICGEKVQRLVSAPALQFKGSGWYITDYARSGNGGDKSGAKDSKDSKASESGAKSDSKTESKAESKTESKTETKAADTTKKS
jgi:putative FmdB family regulatory protein